jgi:hypothetical protein
MSPGLDRPARAREQEKWFSETIGSAAIAVTLYWFAHSRAEANVTGAQGPGAIAWSPSIVDNKSLTWNDIVFKTP